MNQDQNTQKDNREALLEQFRLDCRRYAEAIDKYIKLRDGGQLDPDMKRPSVPSFPVHKYPF